MKDPALAAAAGIAARNAESDGNSVGEATVRALTDAGFPRCFSPARWGGQGVTFSEVTRAVARIGEASAPAAWIASLLAYNGRFAGYLPAQGQKEIWADSPDVRLASSMVATGVRAHPQKDGWLMSGRWLYVSGVEFADWVLLSSGPPRLDDRSIIVFAIPRGAFEYEETWSAIGMNATGSHTVVVGSVFVPAHRVFIWDDMRRGEPAGASSPTLAAPLFSVNGLTFAAPVLGAARGALALAQQHLSVAPSAARSMSRSANLVTYSWAAGEIDAADLLLCRAAAVADGGLQADDALASRNHRDCALAVRMLVTAVDRLFDVIGTRGYTTSHGMQRIWRDVHAAASHAALQFEPAARAFTQHLEVPGPTG